MDRAAGLRLWAAEFCAGRDIDAREVEWIVAADGDGLVPKIEFFTRLRERLSLPDSVAELEAQYRHRHPALIPAVPGALAGLARLRHAGWKIGLVTNGLADIQLATMTHTRVAGRVDGWAISGAEDVRKPEQRLFELAAGRCGLALTGGGWMVGDSVTADIDGGRAAGLHTVWVSRGRLWPEATGEPDHIVVDAAEAIRWLLTR